MYHFWLEKVYFKHLLKAMRRIKTNEPSYPTTSVVLFQRWQVPTQVKTAFHINGVFVYGLQVCVLI